MASIDFDNFDFSNLDPEKISLGTRQQDCLLIAETFEKAAHSIPTEAAAFSTLSRQIQNNIGLSKAMKNSLDSYFITANKDLSQSFNLGNQDLPLDEQFAKKLMDLAKDCIPCEFRLSALAEVKPGFDIFEMYKSYYDNAIKQLEELSNIFNDFDIYGDFCSFINLFNFLCIPDLQRILSLLMALFLLDVPRMLAFFNLLKCLIVPLFAPIILALQSMLEQYMQIVTQPLDCVVEAINFQINKFSVNLAEIRQSVKPEDKPVEDPKQTKAGAAIHKYASYADLPGDKLNQGLNKLYAAATPDKTVKVSSKVPLAIKEVSNGIKLLNEILQDGLNKLKEKLKFYEDQARALIGDISGGDRAYIQAKLRTIQIVRMIAFVRSAIIAISKGKTECDNEKSPEKSELDNFFDKYINNSTFKVTVDNNGQLVIDEGELIESELPQLFNSKNVIQFERDTVLDISNDLKVKELGKELGKTTHVVKQCKLETSTEDVNKVNEWISQLSK